MEYADFLRNRISELARSAYDTGTYRFSKFHGLRSLETYHRMKNEISYISTSLYGGYPNSERNLIVFGDRDEMGYEPDIPVSILKIEAFDNSFNGNGLRHRDYMGAILGLGIDKSYIGDIVVSDKTAYVPVLRPADSTIAESLDFVGRCSVGVSYAEGIPDTIRNTKNCEISVASLRIDAILSGVLHLSRSASAELITREKVFLNGITVGDQSKTVREGDRIAVRGHGMLMVGSMSGMSRKGRNCMSRKGRNIVHITMYL